jgi:hypothetical protein
MFLPFLLKWYVNKTLDQIPGYSGSVDDIGVSLLRGAYQIRGLEIVKTSGKIPVPFVAADVIDLSIQWKELLHGALVGEIEADGLTVNFVKGRTKEESQAGIEEAAEDKSGGTFARHKEAASDWRDVVTKLFPLRINHFQIQNGAVHFKDTSSEPVVDVYLNDVSAKADNLTNSREISKTLMATLELSAKAMQQGNLSLHLRMNPYNKQPTFDMDMSLRDLDLTDLNDFLRHYAGFDVRRGRVDIFSEVAASDGNVKGYVKPLVRDINVVSLKKEGLHLETVKKVLIEWVAALFTNRRTDALGTQIDFEGRLDGPESSTWSAIKFAFRNAFIKALSERLEGSVSLKDIRKK